MFLSEYNLDPWLLNKNNQSPFDLLDPIKHTKKYKHLLDIWSNKIYHQILINDSTLTSSIHTTTTTTTIFKKIQYIFDDSTFHTLIGKITKYM